MKRNQVIQQQWSNQEYSPLLKKYLGLMRQNELMILAMVFLFVEIAVASFTFNSYRMDQSKTLLRTMNEKKDHAGLVQYYQRLLKESPNNPDHNYRCAFSAYQLKDYKLAAECGSRVVKTNPQDYKLIFCLLAKSYFHLNEPKLTDEYLSYCLQLRIFDAELRLIIGDRLFRANKLTEAAEWIQLCIDDPEFGDKAKMALRGLESRALGKLARIDDKNFEPVILGQYGEVSTETLKNDQLHPALVEYLRTMIGDQATTTAPAPVK